MRSLLSGSGAPWLKLIQNYAVDLAYRACVRATNCIAKRQLLGHREMVMVQT